MAKLSDAAEVSRSYDLWAGTYDTDPNKTRELAADVLRRCDLARTGRQVIEIGCGTGRNTAWLAEQAASVLAMDISAGMLRQARSFVTARQVSFVRQDIRTAWSIADASAEVIVAMLVLEHLETLEMVLAEAARTLRPGGEMFLCELHPTRQLMGRQAEFVHPESGKLQRIAAYLHDVADYVNGAIAAGFTLRRLGEWRDADAGPGDAPRLLSLMLVKSN